jgi:hypothetical protein
MEMMSRPVELHHVDKERLLLLSVCHATALSAEPRPPAARDEGARRIHALRGMESKKEDTNFFLAELME